MKKKVRVKAKITMRRLCFIAPLLVIVVMIVAIAVPNLVISSYGRYSFDLLDKMPPVYCAILLGASKYLAGGRENLYYKYRIEAAKRLYGNGGCKKIIVSGDNGTRQYNEPRNMRKDLIKAGVRTEDIISDYAGFRTLDSIIRFKKIFGRQRGVVISQKFHNERAIYIGRSYGIELYGYNALDVEPLHTEPKFLGKQIKV
jgi:SanA protein